MKKAEVPLWAKQGSLCWYEIRDKTGLEVLEYQEGVVTVADFDKQIIKVKINGQDPEQEVKPQFVFERIEEHHVVEDLAAIPTLNDAELLKHLEVRYKKDLIHCFCGPTLLVINPYKRVDREESQEVWDNVHKHLKDGTLGECFPHLWTISAKCWEGLFKTGTNQAICISGESGAGKTESTKRCMAFLTKMNTSRQSMNTVPIEDKILACNPLLEAFGNAKTFRNDNSSRFGKYTVLYVDQNRKKVRGASIENYLLEKSRVVILGKEERNYHVFYCLCRFGSPEQLKKYKLNNQGDKCDMSKFEYLNKSGVYTVPKINDEEFMNDIQTSLRNLDFSEEEQDCIWRNVAAILHLGNVKVDSSSFVEGQNPCKIVKDQNWKNACEILQIDETLFEQALTHKEIKVGASVTRSPLAASYCKNSIDSISKEIYNRMFTWLVLKLNQTLVPEGDYKSYGTIGILDIFGFEIFDKNSLEQFFINFANERLQSLYIEYIFKNECKIFEEEGLAEYTQLIVFTDNKPIVNALEFAKMPPGIFNLVDGACAMNKTDDKLHADIKQQHGNSTVISFPKFAKELSFIVKHTARDVEYLTDGFVEKNKDELSPFLKQAFDTSYATIVAIFDMKSGLRNLPPDDPNAKVNPKEKFLGFKFRRDMTNLVDQLIACNCHFIRCIKPNEVKKQDFWNAYLALLQVQYMGLLDSLKVRKQSYPNRFLFSKFFQLYQDLDMGENGAKNFRVLEEQKADFKSMVKGVFQYVDRKPTEKDVLYGSGRIFLQEEYKIYLDKILLVKQKKKKEALKCIAEMYLTYEKKMGVKSFFVGQAKSILIARDLLKSSTAKLDGLKFKNYLKLIRVLQFKFRFQKEKRLKRYQSHNMISILRYLGMYKFSQVSKYILYYKRKIQMMQAMLDQKIRDAKNRHCRAIVEDLFNIAWKNISKEIVGNSALVLQRSFRAYQLRQKKGREYQVLEQKIAERQEYSNASSVQKHIRGYLVRMRMEKLNSAAAKIQGFMRTRWMRQYFVKLIKATRKIQIWWRRVLIRLTQIREKLNPFMQENGKYMDNLSQLEDRILFGDQKELTNIENLSDYQKLPFYQQGINVNFGNQNYKKFLPPIPEIEIQPKAKFVSLLIDLDVYTDSTTCYETTWAKGFLDLLEELHSKGKRLVHLEIGDSFSMGVSEDREIYSWGMNDSNQCARYTENMHAPLGKINTLSSNSPKLLSLGKDHGIMSDESGRVYVWGQNREGQLGLGHSRDVHSIVVLEDIKGTVKSIQTKENKCYLLNEQGHVYEWPSDQRENIMKPQRLMLDKSYEIISLSVGIDFVMLLSSNGVLFTKGENRCGELGLDDYQSRSTLCPITFFSNKNEKVVEVSCGYKHVICRTALKKVFTWGINHKGQLGLGDKVARPLPEQLSIPDQKGQRVTPRTVQAGLHSCFILLSDRNLYYTGKTGSKQKPVLKATRFPYEDKIYAQRVADNFAPIKIVTKWSGMMSVSYLILADFRQTKMNVSSREKFIDQINQEWMVTPDFLLPNHSVLLSKQLDSKYMLPLGKRSQPLNTKYSSEFALPQFRNYDSNQNDFEETKKIPIQNQNIKNSKQQSVPKLAPKQNEVKQVTKQNDIKSNTMKQTPKQNDLKQSSMIQSKETALPKSQVSNQKQEVRKNEPAPKTPVKKPMKSNQLSGDLQKKIELIMKKDSSQLTAQEQQIIKMYKKMLGQ